MRKIGLVGVCLIVLAGTSLAAQNLDPKVLDLLQNVIQQVKSGELTQAHLEALVRHQNPFGKVATKTEQVMDYTRPLADLIKDCKFDWVNSNITEKHFPTTNRPNGQVEMKLFHFNRVVNSDEAIREMDKEGYRPAELPEVLAYAKNYPDEQRKYPIVSLGSVWQGRSGYRDVPFLYSDGDERGLELYWPAGEWHWSFRFLAVRK